VHSSASLLTTLLTCPRRRTGELPARARARGVGGAQAGAMQHLFRDPGSRGPHAHPRHLLGTAGWSIGRRAGHPSSLRWWPSSSASSFTSTPASGPARPSSLPRPPRRQGKLPAARRDLLRHAHSSPLLVMRPARFAATATSLLSESATALVSRSASSSQRRPRVGTCRRASRSRSGCLKASRRAKSRSIFSLRSWGRW